MRFEEIEFRLPVSKTKVQSSVPCIPKALGIGTHVEVPNLKSLRNKLGLPTEYRAGAAMLNGKIYGPPPRLIPTYIRNLYQYLSLKGDPMIKGWEASVYLIRVHPWRDGNGRTSRLLYRRITGFNGGEESLRDLFIQHTIR